MAKHETIQKSQVREFLPIVAGHFFEQGALADLLLVDGNPLENIDLIADPAKNFKVIMKDGRVYKNAL